MSVINNILNIGVDFQSDSEVKRIRILNGVAFFSALILVFNGIMIFVGSYPFEKFTLGELYEYLISNSEIIVAGVRKFRIVFPLMDFMLAFFAFISLGLNLFRKPDLSAFVICMIANIYIAFFYWLSGYFSVFFFFIPALIPLVFYRKARFYLPFLIFTIVIFIILTVIKYNNGISELFIQPPTDKALLNSLLNFTAVFGILYFIVFHFKRENTINEKILKEKNTILDEQAKKIQLQHDEVHKKNNELIASERKLKELNATKDKFISILAHDLKNPFNSLLGSSELLLENYRDYDEKQMESLLGTLHQASKTTYKLLEQILLWANSQSGNLTIVPEEFKLIEVTNDLVKELENQAHKKKIKINLCVKDDVVLNADLNVFKTVMRNLLTNAIKFNNPNGDINIFSEVNHQSITITVSDNGIGIDENIISKLLEIKESYSTAGTENEIGTGFGLKLCKELIDKHKGEIRVESEIGKGSDFEFTLPLSYS